MTFVDRSYQIAISIMLVTLYSTSCIIQTTVGIATAIRYKILNKVGKISSDQKAAVILFLYSLSLTAGQILRATYHGTVIVAILTSNSMLSSFMQKRLPIIVDVSVLTGSIFLLLLR
uniref:Uncharacterized protein n=1 Tax=Panagrolaimus davidi TaxID=227884 RepID=A0A914PAN9_9BILA